MSITSDLKTYTDRVATQGKQALDQAQVQLNDVTGQANEFYGKAKTNAGDLLETAEKAINLDGIISAVEPYVDKAREVYNTQVVERAEALLAEAKKDKRLAPLIERAEQAYDQVDTRVVKPVLERAGLASDKPVVRKAKSTTKSASAKAKATTRATPRPAAKKSAPRKAAARKSTSS